MQNGFTTTDGATNFGPFAMRWSEAGHGPPMLLLHGIYAGANAGEWDALAPLLQPQRSVRAADLLGCGRSDHPDLAYDTHVVASAVAALIRDCDPSVHVVASSLTGAYALRAVAEGARVSRLSLITPTGLGGAQTRRAPGWAGATYAVGRHTPLGDVVTLGLGSRPSVRWFLRNQAFADPDKVPDSLIERYHDAAYTTNAKHITLAFVTGRLALPLDASEVGKVRPDVIWATRERFSNARDAEAWQAAGATVTTLDAGLPQWECPDKVATALLRPPVG